MLCLCCIVSTLLRGTAEANGRELVFSDKVSCAAGEVLKDLVGTKEHDGLEKRQATLRECGVLQMAMGECVCLLFSWLLTVHIR